MELFLVMLPDVGSNTTGAVNEVRLPQPAGSAGDVGAKPSC